MVHSKSMFVEEGRGAIIKKRTKMNRGEGGCPSMCVCSLFFKEMLLFSNFYARNRTRANKGGGGQNLEILTEGTF